MRTHKTAVQRPALHTAALPAPGGEQGPHALHDAPHLGFPRHPPALTQGESPFLRPQCPGSPG